MGRYSRIFKGGVKKLTKVPWLRQVVLPIWKCYHSLQTKDCFSRSAKIYNCGYGNFRKYIMGKSNSVIIGKNTSLNNPLIRIVGYNNQLIIGDSCTIGARCEFWLEGNNVTITIGDNTSFTNDVEVNAQEDNSSISIGKDCMLSNHIIIRTSDSHPIYDVDSNNRINPAKPVVIGNHVWIAPHSTIMKGSIIGDGSIIGSNTIVTKEIPVNSLAVGMPAKVVKQKIKWTKEKIF